jgi:diguanylate cyclase (GGDEF)-like protein
MERDTAKRVTRIRALWQIAYDGEPSEDNRFRRMLVVAAESIRPGKAVLGSLTHLEGDRVVVDASSHSAADWSSLGLAEFGTPGAAFACEGSMHGLLADAGYARAWDDLTLLEGDAARTGEFGWRSFIGAPMIVARRTYFVIFASPDVMTEEPFAEDDIAYVEVVASFFASRFTQQVQFEQIQFEIEHDALTGLENRVQFRQAVRDEIAAGRPLAIAFVNLDGFRHVNERDGHHVGDEVLVEVARALESVSHDDLLVRMSADEFGIVMRGVVSADATADAVERYSQLFLLPFSVGTHGGTRVLSVRASIGAARFPQDGASVEELMRRASVALDVAKNRGGSTTVIFDLPMEAILEESHVRFMELSEAIALDQLALVYQPTFSLQTRAIVGAEALVRWDHPVRGRLLPSEFVGFAERNGLIGPLSRWVFERVARDISQAGALPNGFRIYLNLATHMLDDVPFISKIHELLRATPGLARHLGIEVTETAAMQNVERSLYSIELFRRWGISVAIDDFGTGYSSLSYLKQLTVDVVKIDRSFIAGLPGDERDCALTEMLLRITDQFGFVALAEGIETEAQAAWLLEHHCSLGQGYLVARPDSFDELLARVGMRSLAYEMEKR